MKKYKKIIARLLVATLVLSNASYINMGSKVYAAKNDVTKSVSVADCYVDVDKADQNLNNVDGNYQQMLIKKNAREAYLRFSIKDLPEYIKKVELSLNNNSGSNVGDIEVYMVSDQTWDETTLTWNNKPAKGDRITVFTNGAANTDSLVDITEFVKSEKAKGSEYISVALVGVTDAGLVIREKERADAAQRPYLVVTEGALSDKEENREIKSNADAYVDSGIANVDKNFQATYINPETGIGNGVMFLKEGGSTYNKRVYLKFDISNMKEFNEADLKLCFKQSNDAGELYLYPTDTDWQEDTITWNSVPSSSADPYPHDKAIASATVSSQTPGEPTWYSWNVADYIKSQMADNKTEVSFVLIGTNANDNREVYNRESANSPKLVVNYRYDTITEKEKSRTVIATADAHVDSNTSNVGKNYGNNAIMPLKEGGGEYNRRVLLKFEMEDMKDFNSALLRLNFKSTAQTSNPIKLNLYAAGSSSWGEDTLTWSNMPAQGALVASAEITDQPGWYTWDITDYLKQQLDYNKATVSVILVGTSTDSNREVYSKENGEATAPQIILDFDESAPEYDKATVQDENKKIILEFNETIKNACANDADLKAAITIARDGSTYAALGANDTISVEGRKLTITLENRVSQAEAKSK